jgi:hypothetical protein
MIWNFRSQSVIWLATLLIASCSQDSRQTSVQPDLSIEPPPVGRESPSSSLLGPPFPGSPSPYETGAPLMPCLETSGHPSLWIHPESEQSTRPFQIYGKIVSWNPRARTIGVQSRSSLQVEEIAVKSITFRLVKPNQAAQMPIPSFVPAGRVSRSVPSDELIIRDGLIKFPGCTLPGGMQNYLFDGSITFKRGEIRIEGQLVQVVQPSPGSGSRGDSSRPKGG